MGKNKMGGTPAKPLTKAEKDFIAKNRGMNATELAAALGRPFEEIRQLIEETVSKTSMVRFYATDRSSETAKTKKRAAKSRKQKRLDQTANGGRRLPTQTEKNSRDYAADFTVYDNKKKGTKRVQAQKGTGRSYDGSRERSLQWRRMIEKGGRQ